MSADVRRRQLQGRERRDSIAPSRTLFYRFQIGKLAGVARQIPFDKFYGEKNE
jgi:hypothetical protein